MLPRIPPFYRCLALAIVHIVTALLLFTHGGRDVRLFTSGTALWVEYTLGSDLDLCLASVVAALALVLTSFLARYSPLCCYRSCTLTLASYAAGTFFTLAGTLGLVKVVARPDEDSLFWAQACVLFTASTAEGFMAVQEVEAVKDCALAAAARQCGLAAALAEDAPGQAEPGDGKPPSGVTMGRLLSLSVPDYAYVSAGFLCLVVAAVAGTFVPGLTGAAIDGLAGPKQAFYHTLYLLLGATLLSAVLTGARGWCFTVAISRLKVRLRDMLLRSILAQEQSFFDSTPVGDLVSRLASDTTVVGDQVSLNVNVFLRSAISALGSLVL